jgi:virginiamycin B lyase
VGSAGRVAERYAGPGSPRGVEQAGARGLRSILVRGAAVALASLVFATLALAARADAFVYWTNSVDNTMGRANVDGTGVDQGFFGASNAQGVAVDGAHIYWTIFEGPIGRANLDGTDVNPNFAGGTSANPVSNPQGLAVDSGHLYWGNNTAGVPCCQVSTIGRANLDGTGVDPNFIVVMDATADGVAVDDAHVYWTGSNVIGRANLDGTDVNQSFIAGAIEPWGVAVDGAHIYWVNTGTGTIGRANLDGTGVDQSFINGDPDNVPEGMAVDGAHIYWANTQGPGEGTIGRANLDGTGVDQSFITGAAEPTAVAVDALVGAPPQTPTVSGLLTQVQRLGLPRGTERSLEAKLGAAQRKLDAGHHQPACGSLGAFINEVGTLSGHQLGTAEAGELTAQATAIRDSLGCRV